MTPVLLILCTCTDREEALRIANALVEERLAACVSVLPQVESVYRWQEKVESAQEILLMIKSTAERFSLLRDRIIALHSYETPEVLAITVADGFDKYLAWLRAQV